MPIVSIIVPSHNYAHFLPDTLKCLQSQTLSDWECLIIDDGSTDNTAEIAMHYAGSDQRIRYLHQENAGPSTARNFGISQSSGTYLQFLDADDLIERKKLKLQSEFLEKHPQVDIVYSDVRYFRTNLPNERTLSSGGGNFAWTTHLTGSIPQAQHALVRSNLTAINAPLIRRTVMDIVDGFDDELRYGEDWDFWLRCSLAGLIFSYQNWPETLSLPRAHESNCSRSRTLMAYGEVQIRLKLEQHLDDSNLRAINHSCLRNAQMRFRCEEIMSERKPVTRWLRLLKAGIDSSSLRWFLIAMSLPFLRDKRLQFLLAPLKSAVLPFFARSKSGA